VTISGQTHFTQQLPTYLKTLSKSIKKIELVIEDYSQDLTNSQICKVFKTIVRSKQLTWFSHNIDIDNKPMPLEGEYKIMDRFLRRLPVRDFKYRQIFGCQNEIEDMMNQNKGSKWITYLHLAVEGFDVDDVEEYQPFLIADTSKTDVIEEELPSSYYEHIESFSNSSSNNLSILSSESYISDDPIYPIRANQNIPNPRQIAPREPSEEVRRGLRNAVMPMFKFNMYPSLQSLYLRVSALIPLEDWIIESFSHLKSLKAMELHLDERPVGSLFLFKGLLELPKLNFFHLESPFIKQEEFRILDGFLSQQKELAHLALKVTTNRKSRERYHAQNKGIQTLLYNLNGMTRLRVLYLNCMYWSLESISEGLKHVKMENQLRELEIQGIDDCMEPVGTIRERISGLCEFISRQRNSLDTLIFRSNFIVKVSVVNQLAETISELKQLRKLMFNLNNGRYLDPERMLSEYEKMKPIKSFKEIRKEMKLGKSKRPKIANMLKGLDKLESLNFAIRTITGGPEDCVKWFVDILKMIPAMKSLRRLDFELPRKELNAKEVNEMRGIMMSLENVKEIGESWMEVDMERTEVFMDLERYVERYNQKQVFRSDLMF